MSHADVLINHMHRVDSSSFRANMDIRSHSAEALVDRIPPRELKLLAGYIQREQLALDLNDPVDLKKAVTSLEKYRERAMEILGKGDLGLGYKKLAKLLQPAGVKKEIFNRVGLLPQQ